MVKMSSKLYELDSVNRDIFFASRMVLYGSHQIGGRLCDRADCPRQAQLKSRFEPRLQLTRWKPRDLRQDK